MTTRKETSGLVSAKYAMGRVKTAALAARRWSLASLRLSTKSSTTVAKSLLGGLHKAACCGCDDSPDALTRTASVPADATRR